jgi:hypothetical protein
VKCSELVFVQHNPLYDNDDDDDVFDQQSVKEQHSENFRMQTKLKLFMNLHFKSFLLTSVKKTFQ